MEPWMLTKLDQSLIGLSKCLDIRDTILRLRVSNIFDSYDNELIMNNTVHRTDCDKRLKIVEILRTRDARAYWKFCHYIQQKCPHIFRDLHDAVINDNDQIHCPVCQPDELDNFSKPHCDYCKGLISVFSNPESGVYIEDAEGLLDVIMEKDRLITKLKCDCETKYNDMKRLKNENQLLNERITINLNQIAIKEEDMVKTEKKFSKLSTSQEILKIENEELHINTVDGANKIKELEEQVKVYRDKYEEAIKIESEEVDKEDPTAVYINREVYWKNKNVQLEQDLKNAEQQISAIKKDLLNQRKVNSQLKIQKESAEELYERMKLEHKRSCENIENKLQCTQMELETSLKLVIELEQKNSELENHLEDYAYEKNHVVDKLYEKEKILKETAEQLEISRKEYKDLKELYDIKCGSVNNLEGSREDITSQYMIVLKERDAEREKSSELSLARDQLVYKVIALQKKEQDNVRELECKQMYVTSLGEECSNLQRKIDQMSELRNGDYEVTLTKSSREKKFGVSFITNKGPLALSKSRIQIAKVDPNCNATPFASIGIGDYVIKVNDINVQDSEIDRVREIESRDLQTMKLVLRRPARIKPQLINIRMQSSRQSLEEYGLKLVVMASHSKESLIQSEQWFHPHDEVVQVGGETAESLSIDAINSKIRNKFRRGHTIDFIVKREKEETTTYRSIRRRRVAPPPIISRMASQRSSSSSEFSDIGNSYPPPPYPLETSEGDISMRTAGSTLLKKQISKNDSHPQFQHQISGPFDSQPQQPPTYSQEASLQHYRHFDSIVNNFPQIPGVGGQLPVQTQPVINPQAVDERQRIPKSSPTVERPGQLPPRCPTISKQAQSQGSVNILTFSESRDNGYNYVITKRFDAKGNPLEDVSAYESEMKTIILKKQSYANFGFEIVGGNKVGIYIKSVGQWGPAATEGFQVGWRILKINGLSLDKVAFCYAVEYLTKLQDKTRVEFTFEVIPREQYEVVVKQKPYDFFHVEALQDYKPQRPQEMAFEKGDILNVTNTHVVLDPKHPYLWEATKENNMSSSITGYIPRLISATSPSRIRDHPYDFADMDRQRSPDAERLYQRPPAPVRAGSLYKILESIGEVLV